MSVHFMAVLGTSLYEPVVYSREDFNFSEREEEFIQLAYIESLREELKENGKTTIFVTSASKSRNWEDRQYTSNDQELAFKWVSERKEEVVPGNKKKGMKTQIAERFPELMDRINCVEIPDGKNEEEIDLQFQRMFHAIEEGDEIVFDITHSFRSIPMLAMTVINYAKILLNCSLREIVYGAFEARNPETNVAPIFNLTVYNEVLEWTSAAEMFIRYGNARPMNDLVKKKKAMLPNQEKSSLSWLENRTRDLAMLTDNIATCRGQRADKVVGNRAGSSIEGAYTNMVINKGRSDKAYKVRREIKPLLPLIEKAEESMQGFHCEHNYEIGMNVVRWSIKNNMIQQGYTALEESIKTYLCYYCGLDDAVKEEREFYIGNILGVINNVSRDGLEDTIEGRKKIYERWEQDHKTKDSLQTYFAEQIEQRQLLARQLIMEIDFKLVNRITDLKARRNDINHFGMRVDPASSDKLKEDLANIYRGIQEGIQSMEKKKAGN